MNRLKGTKNGMAARQCGFGLDDNQTVCRGLASVVVARRKRALLIFIAMRRQETGTTFSPPEPFPQARNNSFLDYWIDELEYTVDTLLRTNATLMMWVNPDDHMTKEQFGDPSLVRPLRALCALVDSLSLARRRQQSVQNADFSNFSAVATLAALSGATLCAQSVVFARERNETLTCTTLPP